MSQKGATFDYDWFGSTKIGLGDHTVELRAYDEAGNVGVATTTVVRGNPAHGEAHHQGRAGLKVKRKGNRFELRATVKPPKNGAFGEQPHGRLRAALRAQAGPRSGSARRSARASATAACITRTRPARRARGGSTRYLDVDAPYAHSKTTVVTFKIR